jgi:hypothetical protein
MQGPGSNKTRKKTPLMHFCQRLFLRGFLLHAGINKVGIKKSRMLIQQAALVRRFDTMF